MYQKTRKIPLSHYFWIFLLASVIGTYYEEILHIVNYFMKHHTFHYSRRSGLFWGPISPVYGFGAVLFLFILGRKERSKPKLFVWSAIIGGLAEYLMSIAQELLTGTTSWDYSDKFLNIQGRTTIPYMLGWGLAGLILVAWVYPKIVKLLSKIPEKPYKIITSILFVLVFVDILITWTAVARKEMKDRGIEPYTFIGEFYDSHFDEEYIEKKYPNTEEKEE